MPGESARRTLRSAASASWRILWDALLPSRCPSCTRPRRDLLGGGICGDCWARLPLSDPDTACPRCALPGAAGGCRDCAHRPPPFGTALALGPYEGVLRDLVLAYKFHGYDILAAPAARRLCALDRAASLLSGADALVPVPSTARRNRARGYDPAGLLAEELSRRSRRPVRALLGRRGDTAPQSTLPASRRPANVAGAFRASRAAADLRLVLVDDVMTTGATAFEAARALLSRGARRVDLLVLARTPDPEDFRHPETGTQ